MSADVTGITHNVLVLGSGGKLGRFLRAAWRLHPPRGIAPVFQSRSTPGCLNWTPDDDLAELPRADAVVALWGVTRGNALSDNSRLAHAAQEIASHVGARCVLHMSSVAVYGSADHPIPEHEPPAPFSDYGRAKLAMENQVRSDTKGVNTSMLRVGNVVGADSLAAAMTRENPLWLDRFPDGHGPKRSYISPSDFARVIAAMVRLDTQDLPDIVNVAAPDPVGMDQLLDAAGVRFEWRDAPQDALQSVSIDTGRLQTLLGDVIQSRTPARMIADWRELEGQE